MSIVVEKPGMLTTVQDLGRPRYRRMGINPGGAMDKRAVQLTNILLGNDENAAVLEMHFPAPKVIFEEDCIIAIGGADLGAHVDGEPIECWRPYAVRAGAKLRFTEKRNSTRAYLAVPGGFDLPHWLGSASTNLGAGIGGFDGRPLRSGDKLPIRRRAMLSGRFTTSGIAPSLLPRYSRFPTVRIIAGAEFPLLSDVQQKVLLANDFEVTGRSDRMGFRLSGPEIRLDAIGEMVSAAVDFGTVQLLPDGQMIVLMAESQTAGGYPRIAHIVSVDLPLVGQLGPGDKLRFHIVDHVHAEQLALAAETELSFFRVGCRLQAQSWTS